jgi:hypothetical protein
VAQRKLEGNAHYSNAILGLVVNEEKLTVWNNVPDLTHLQGHRIQWGEGHTLMYACPNSKPTMVFYKYFN